MYRGRFLKCSAPSSSLYRYAFLPSISIFWHLNVNVDFEPKRRLKSFLLNFKPRKEMLNSYKSIASSVLSQDWKQIKISHIYTPIWFYSLLLIGIYQDFIRDGGEIEKNGWVGDVLAHWKVNDQCDDSENCQVPLKTNENFVSFAPLSLLRCSKTQKNGSAQIYLSH
jgi:hypothetical protein